MKLRKIWLSLERSTNWDGKFVSAYISNKSTDEFFEGQKTHERLRAFTDDQLREFCQLLINDFFEPPWGTEINLDDGWWQDFIRNFEIHYGANYDYRQK